MSDRSPQRRRYRGGLWAKVLSRPLGLLILIPFVFLIVLPVFQYGLHVGQGIMPSVTNYFYTISGPTPSAVPTQPTSFPTLLPQIGVLPYTVQAGDSCD